MKDFLGREISPGDFIVYGRRDGNSTKTTLYRVVSTEAGVIKARGIVYNKYGNLWVTSGVSRIHNYDAAVIIRPEDIPQEVKDRYDLLVTNDPNL